MQQVEKREQGGEHAADELNKSGADQVAHAFHVGHDAGNQCSGAVLVVVAH